MNGEQKMREALTLIIGRLAEHPEYAELTEQEEEDIGGDKAEFSYLVRVGREALASQPAQSEAVAWLTDRQTAHFDREDARRDCDGFIEPLCVGSVHAPVHGEPPHWFPAAARLALDLQCLLLDIKDMPTVTRWWDSAHEALADWYSVVYEIEQADEAAPPAPSVPDDVVHALRSWTGTEPSQSVLGVAVDRWLAAAPEAPHG